MGTSTGRLSRAFEVQSVARLGGDRLKTLEGPAAAEAAVLACETRTRDLPTPHSFPTYEGADMAKRTRLSGRSDSRTRATAVKITPATHPGPVTTTHTVA